MAEDALKTNSTAINDIKPNNSAEFERLKLALEISRVGLIEWNLETDEIFSSLPFLNKLGYHKNEIPTSPESLFSIVHPDDLNSIKSIIDEFRLGILEYYEIETRIRSKAGEWLWFSCCGKPVERDMTGKPLKIFGTLTEITEKKNYEIKVLESEDKFYKAFQMSQDFNVITTFPEGRCIEVNDIFLNTLGYDREEIIGKNSPDMKIWESTQQRDLIVQLIKQNGFCNNIEMTCRKKNGDLVFGLFSARLINLSAGPVVYGIFKDITERKRVEEALLESEKKFASIIETAAEGIIIADVNTRRFIYVNSEISALLGYTREELTGRCVNDIHPPESLSHALDQFKALVSGKTKFTPSIPFLRKNGTVFYADVRASVITIEGIEYTVGFFTDITDRRQAEEARNELLMLFEAQFRTSPDIILIIDQNYKIVNINKILAGNFTIDNIIGKDAIEVLPPESRGQIHQRLKDCFTTGEPQEFEHNIGDGKWVSARILRLAQTGKPHHLMIISTDITERRQALKILHIQKNMSIALAGASGLKELGEIVLNAVTQIEGIDSGGLYMRNIYTGELNLISHKGLSGEFIRANSYYPADSPNARIVIKGDPLFIFYSDLNIPKDTGITEGLKQTSIIPIRHENVVVACLNLASHTHSEVPSSIRDSLEAIGGMLGDSIARIRNETEIREINARIHSIIESPIDIFIYSMDTNYNLTSYNEAFKRFIFNLGNIKLETGMNMLDIPDSPAHRSGIKQDYDRALKGESITETVNIHDSIYEFIFNPIFEKNNKVIGVSCFIRNITEQKNMEEKLRQSEKMEAIGQLAGGIAHDFNNELAIISGYSDLIRDEVKNNPDVLTYIDSIIKCVKRSSNLISQMLAFSRKGKFLSTSVDIHEMISEIILMLSHSIDKRILIKQKLKANPSITVGDPSQLKSAILNLALNARDAMSDGGELLFKTETVNITDEIYTKTPFYIGLGRYIVISVSDTGTGMDKETQSHLFEPFFTTKERGKGTGFGLASVYGTVKNHNGMINVISEPGHGSTFKIYLPVAPEDAKVKSRKADAVRSQKIPANILLIEDEDALRNIAEKTLAKLGCKVTTCKDGKEGVNYYKKNWRETDIVILDMIMPVMNGRDAFIAMKKINPGIKALLTSGYSFDGEAQALIDKGVTGFLQKPFRRDELMQKITGILNSGNKSD